MPLNVQYDLGGYCSFCNMRGELYKLITEVEYIFVVRPVSAVKPSSATDNLRWRYHTASVALCLTQCLSIMARDGMIPLSQVFNY